jgi:tRNA nucleotidyltransferase (CCA-adding enzyme)
MLNYPENVIKIAEIMKKHGYRAYAVGGCVRDSVMGRVPSDWDMTTDASPENMIKIFDFEGVRTIPTGLKHGTVTVLLDGDSFELTTFRIDGSYTDSRHPDGVTFTRNLEDDLARRDFTINAMAADPLFQSECEEREIIDIYNGMDDIKNKIIRAVGEPERRFSEDALRILRAVRFASTLGFEIEEETMCAAKKLRDGLNKVSIERKKVELEKMLVSDGADYGVDLILNLGLEKYIHNELKKPKISLMTLSKRFETRMAAMFFDNENIPDLSGLKLSRVESTNIKKLCDKSKFCPELSEKNARRMIYEYGELASDAAILHGYLGLAEIIKKEAKNSPCVSIAQLKISGTDLIESGIEPKKVGKMMEKLLFMVIDDPTLNTKEKLLESALK